MFNYLVRRLLYAPLIIFGVMLLTFFIFFVVQKPEQMARGILGKRANPTSTYAWLHKRGYDKPLFFNTGQKRDEADGNPYDSDGFFDTIFFNKMKGYATLNLGISDVTNRELGQVFREGAIPSLMLTLPAFLVGFIMSVGIALFLVFVRNSALDTSGVFLCVALMSIPAMVYIIFGQAVVALGLNYFPAFGFEHGFSSIRFLLLPVSLIVIMNLGYDVQLYRAIFLEEIAQDYIRTARAKGLPTRRVLLVHLLKNGMIALITLLVARLPLLILGALLVESFFGIPGLGNLLFEAIQTQDLAEINAVTFLTSILYIVGLMLTDVCYALVDPRIRLS
jgi:peptide/nickel transport system permease protein